MLGAVDHGLTLNNQGDLVDNRCLVLVDKLCKMSLVYAFVKRNRQLLKSDTISFFFTQKNTVPPDVCPHLRLLPNGKLIALK